VNCGKAIFNVDALELTIEYVSTSNFPSKEIQMPEQSRAAARSDSPALVQPYYMTFDQSAHLDWDWKLTFAQHFWYSQGNQASVQQILTDALANLQKFNSRGSKPYYYSICEMSFLRKFVEENPQEAAAIQNAGDNFQVLGGGMTSPDCLVCSGEGFIRNYLVGHVWLSQYLRMVQPRPHCIIPDDFGQGPELPVLLQALGFVGVCFSRLPGTSHWNNPALQTQLLQNGFDFIWRAADGSQAIGHWMGASYGFSNGPLKGGAAGIDGIVALYNPGNQQPYQYSAAVTPYMYMPVEDDFSPPLANLLDDINQWDTNQAGEGESGSNVAVVAATFDTFVSRIAPLQGKLATLAPYNGTPYWTGYYASRPALKILHYAATRLLVAAEIFAMLTQPNNANIKNLLSTDFWEDLSEAWMAFAPSTHHDYVCGTAIDSVYATEQLPLLQAVEARARGLRAAALNALAGNIPADSELSIVVANSLGFEASGLAEIMNVAFPDVQSVSFDGLNFTPVQRSAEGGMLLMATVPSLGYVSGNLATDTPSSGPDVLIVPQNTGANSYLLKNQALTATISESAGWGIESLVDNATGAKLLAPDVPGNDLVFYEDGGDIYEFGNEYYSNVFQVDQKVQFATTGPGLGAIVLESGPLRVRLRTVVLATVSSGEARYITREYVLVAGEPFLRMSTTGAAPSAYSVMTRFRFTSQVAGIVHGTGYHWTTVQPAPGFWSAPVFRPTHEFLLPQDSNNKTLAAVYHGAIPAWAFDAGGGLIGCLLRNTPKSSNGAGGTDPAAHTQHYALRVPSGLRAPDSGEPLKEALAFNNPLQAVEIPPIQGDGMAPAGWHLAAATSPAILTVAKPYSFNRADLVLRLYQPSNKSQTVAVALANGRPKAASVVTAAEGVWNGPAMPIQLTGTGFSLGMNAALATVRVEGAGLPERAPRR
jgi:alpha-mannosidase